MLEKELRKLMMETAKSFGLKPGFNLFSPYPFGSLNQQNSRQGIDNKDFFWIENFIKVGEANLRTVWDQGASIYTAPGGSTIVYFGFYNIGATNYCAVFLSDGSAVQVNTATKAQTNISSTAGTFYAGGQLPVIGQWGNQYLLISNNFNANAYWIWNGSVLFSAGGLAPQITLTTSGSGYSSPPTVTFFGGQGSGATATATVTAGVVTSVQITNPGMNYKPGDVVQLQFSGGGSNAGAILKAVLTGTTIGHISLLSGGSGYSAGVTATISGGGGTGALATVTQSNGIINSITLTAAGSGYTSTPTITFNDPVGNGATASILLNPTSVASVSVTSGGDGYTSTPLLTFSGGGGTGATATATLTTKAISSVAVGAGGSGYTTVPAVVVQTGINNAAAGTASLMPYGVSGSSIETFQSRVWLPFPYQSGFNNTGGQFLLSAPGSLTDFATSDGGLVFTSTDAFLKAQYTNMKQSNGYLYPIGDSSVSVISNIQTSGSPSTTTFNYQNTDPQIGTLWRDTVVPYSRTILFANPLGAYGLYGGAVTKISKKLDTLFNNAIFDGVTGVVPTAATANIFSIKVFLLNMTVADPFTNAYRTVLLAWDETDWHVLSQSSQYTFIATQEVASNLIAYGTDGSGIYPMFQTASQKINKTISTKLYGQDKFLVQQQSMGVYLQVQDLSGGIFGQGTGITLSSLTIDAEHGSYPVPSIPAFPANSSPPYYPIISIGSGDIYGDNLGLTLISNSKDFTLNFIGIGYVEAGSIAMSSTPIAGTIYTE